MSISPQKMKEVQRMIAENDLGGALRSATKAYLASGISGTQKSEEIIAFAKIVHLCGQPHRALRLLLPLAQQHQQAGENVAMICENLGDQNNAKRYYLDLQQCFPDSIIAWVNYGSILIKSAPVQALSYLGEALLRAPGHPQILHQCAVCHQQQKDWTTALEYFKRALDRQADYVAAQIGIVRCLIAQRQADPAEKALDTLVASSKRQATPLNNALHTELHAGICYLRKGPMTALRMLKKQQIFDSDNTQLLCLAAFYAHESREFSLAEMLYQRALMTDQNHLSAQVGLSKILLQKQEYERGFAAYETRRQLPQYQRNISVPQLRTDTEQPLQKHESILIIPDQGMGDQIMFMRFLPDIAQQVKQLDIAGLPPLQSLLQRVVQGCNNVCLVGNRVDTQPQRWHRQIPITSLGRVMRLSSSKDIIKKQRYIPRSKQSLPGNLLPKQSNNTMRCGVVWRGNPHHSNNHQRSLHLGECKQLWDIPNVQWFALQHQITAEEESQWPEQLINTSQYINDFDDLRLILSHLDALISVDSAPLHLAGAMGIPTHALIPYVADWRWGQTGIYCDWYDSVRLWRQPGYRDWTTVILALQRHMIDLSEQHKQKTSG